MRGVQASGKANARASGEVIFGVSRRRYIRRTRGWRTSGSTVQHGFSDGCLGPAPRVAARPRRPGRLDHRPRLAAVVGSATSEGVGVSAHDASTPASGRMWEKSVVRRQCGVSFLAKHPTCQAKVTVFGEEQVCGRLATIADHVIPIEEGIDPWDESNWQHRRRRDRKRRHTEPRRRP